MDAWAFPWVTADNTALWVLAPVPCAVTTLGTGPPDFSTSVNCPMGDVANTPSFSTVAPALQGVIALNLSFVDSTGNPSAVDLDSLLAGLLDNSTGGVNGTFRDETGNLSSLGLAGPVMSALANGVWDSGGIFGAPVSYGQPNPPSPPGCSGFLGCVWNTVSGVVVGIAGAIYGAVRAAVLAALQVLLAFIKNAITTLLGTAIHPLQQAFTNYWRSVESPLSETQNYTSQGQSPPTSSLVAVWSALGGSVFMDTMLLSTVLAAVVTVIMTVNLGTSFLLPILLTVIITAALQESPLGTLLSDLQSEFEQLLSGSTVQAVEGWIDSHPSLLSKERSANQPTGARSAQATGGSDPGWQTLIEILSVSVSISFGFKFVVNELNTCAQPSEENNIACSWFVIGAGIALEVITIGIHLVSLTQPVPSGLHILGLIFSILATVITGIRAYFEELKGLKVIEGLVAILGLVAIGVSLAGIPR